MAGTVGRDSAAAITVVKTQSEIAFVDAGAALAQCADMTVIHQLAESVW
ncbi:MAG: hypothetical protein IPF83_11385 [Rhodanobacteraceae bacterium]|nr:hypothetical protein [Rhodanobacteraceae bacterium]